MMAPKAKRSRRPDIYLSVARFTSRVILRLPIIWSSSHQRCVRLSTVAGFQPAFGVQRRHASSARRSHGLAIDLVGDVTGGEYSRGISVCRAALDLEVPQFAHLELALEDRRVWLMADRHENTGRAKVGGLVFRHVLEAHRPHAALPVA